MIPRAPMKYSSYPMQPSIPSEPARPVPPRVRAHERYRFQAEIEVAALSGCQRATLQDISVGGARFVTRDQVGNWGGSVVLLVPSTQGSGDVEVTGVIVRTERCAEGCSIAVRFEPQAPWAKERLDRLIRSLGGKVEN